MLVNSGVGWVGMVMIGFFLVNGVRLDGCGWFFM